jgi:LemA protein
MNKKFIYIGLAILIVGWFVSSYNSMVSKNEVVAEKWAQVETVYQRRADLIPNLVATVKGVADFEQSTLTAVIEARSKATSMTIDASKLDATSMQKFQAAQGELTGSLSKLLVSVERYPELKANQNFLELQAQLEGTENRISVERNRFNTVTKEYNSYIKKLQNKLIAGLFGFDEKPYFEADAGAEKAPEVQF